MSFGSVSISVVGMAASSSLVGIVIAASVLSMLATGFGIIIIGTIVVVALLSSSRGIIGVISGLRSLLVLIIVGSGKGWQRPVAASLVVVGFFVVAKVIIAASLSLVLAISCVVVVVLSGVCSASGLEVVPLVVVVQRAGRSLHEGTIAR